MKEFICHVCGYPKLKTPPWGEDGITPNFDTCPCCGVDFGYEDILETAYLEYKDQWIKSGKWLMEKERPNDWSMEKQLENIKNIDPKLRPPYLR